MNDQKQPGAVVNPMAGTLAVAPAAGGLITVEQQRAVAETQARILLARANPRDVVKATDLIIADCQMLALAEEAMYAYSRGGTKISGPSIRLAEGICRRWGNIATGIKEVSRRDGYSECRAEAWDLETGYFDFREFQIKHWRDKKDGGGYLLTDERDIYELIANQGQRRKRACMLAMIPGAVVDAAVAQCERTLKAKTDMSPEGIQKMLDAFAQLGVSQKQIETRIQRRLDAIEPAQVISLKRIYVSLRDEVGVVGDFFEPVEAGSVAPTPAPPPRTKKEYSAEIFAEQLAKWAKIIAGGKKTAEQIIATASSTHDLTDQQKAAIAAIKGPEGKA